MSVGDVAGLIAAIAFVLLVGLLAVPLIKLGRVLDETRTSVKEITDHTVPVLDETATLVASSNTQLENIDTVTTAAAQVSENVSALTVAVRRDGRRADDQGRRLLLRRAPRAVRPRGERAPEPMMARRLFWLGVGRRRHRRRDPQGPHGRRDVPARRHHGRVDGAQRVSHARGHAQERVPRRDGRARAAAAARPRRRRRRRRAAGRAARARREPAPCAGPTARRRDADWAGPTEDPDDDDGDTFF